MPKSRDSVVLTGRTPEELARQLTFILQRLSDRLDQIEGIRGTATIQSDLVMSENKVREVGAGSVDTDGARLGDLPEEDVTFNSVTTTENVEVGGDLKVYGDDGLLIHSME